MPSNDLDSSSWKNIIKRPKRGVPEGLWRRCPGCQQTIFRKEAEKRLGVCPECDYHWYVSARERIRQVLGTELAAAGWTLVVDAAIERGGCRVQTRFGETDATLQTRWAELTRALGRDTAWLVSERAEAERVAGGALHVA